MGLTLVAPSPLRVEDTALGVEDLVFVGVGEGVLVPVELVLAVAPLDKEGAGVGVGVLLAVAPLDKEGVGLGVGDGDGDEHASGSSTSSTSSSEWKREWNIGNNGFLNECSSVLLRGAERLEGSESPLCQLSVKPGNVGLRHKTPG